MLSSFACNFSITKYEFLTFLWFNFQVNPGAKERLVQITGPNEESINYAKLLIEDTIKRNASPIREASQEGSCSSLASSDDQQQGAQRARGAGNAVSQPQMIQMSMGNKLQRSSSQHNNLYHSLSSNDTSFGEYKYTVNVGNHCLKITGDSLELVKVAKLVLDDFFTNEEFLKPSEALPVSSEASMIPSGHQLPSHPSPFIDSGVHVDLLARSASNILNPQQMSQDNDDDVFDNSNEIPALKSSSSIDSTGSSNTLTALDDTPVISANGLSRSRRSHFSRKESNIESQNVKTTNIDSESHKIVDCNFFKFL